MDKSSNWYEYIEDLVMKYQAGDTESGLQVIKAFEPYFTKYHRILKNGHIDLKDKDSRKFISLFIQDKEVRQKLKKHYQSKEVRNSTYKAAIMLSKICASVPQDDFKQDFCLILLRLCKRYKKRGKKTNFCGYAYNVFRYELHRRIVELTKDPITYRSETNLSFNETHYITPNEEYFVSRKAVDGVPVVIQDDELGNNWITGLTCDDAFVCLTPLQRMIIKGYYAEVYSDVGIADKLGMHKNTIYRNRQKAEDIIAEELGELFVQALREKRNIKLNTRNESNDTKNN